VVKGSGLQRVALFGTKATMSSGFYNKVAERHGMQLITPNEEQQAYIHEKYLGELIYNNIKPETKQALTAIVNDLKKKHSIQGLILGGTELPLILSQDDFIDIRIFDTGVIHVNSIVDLY
jgi:aspartate racemase